MHALVHIRTVIIPRDRSWPEGFSPRVNIGRGMITVLISKKACINLFITYFNIELKRIKLTSNTHQTMSDWYRLRDDNSPYMEKGMHCYIYREIWYHVVLFIKRLDIMLSEFSPISSPISAHGLISLWHFGVYVITYKYVIKTHYIHSVLVQDWYQVKSLLWTSITTSSDSNELWCD
jgi:hypothetical protein